MARDKSITLSASFQSRLLDAERWRLALMAGCIAVLLVMWVARRVMGGVVASADSVFYPVLSILCGGLIAMGVGIWDASRLARKGGTIPWRRAMAGAALDLAIPYGCLLVLQIGSPRGAYAALSGPSLMLVPIIVMLSVLRLRPVFSLLMGLIAAAAHWALSVRAIIVDQIDVHSWPPIFSYGLLIALTGVAAGVLAKFVRQYIQEAVSEAEAAERTGRALVEVEHELDMARTIQMGLLPSGPPRLATFDIAGMARPATKAGGDYYDWQPLPDGRLVIAIADVTGHGVGPALVMAVCRAYARATAPTAASARAFLERMNSLIVGDIKGERFITMAVALVSSSGDIELLSAGHGPNFLYRKASGIVEQFGGNGLPLGIDGDEEFLPTEFLHMDPGDVLVLLTDGFQEHPGPDGRMFGVKQIEAAIIEHAQLPAADLIAAIDGRVAAHAAGVAQNDDMTAVVIRRT